MAWIIYQFSDERGDGVLDVWFRKARIQKTARIRLDQKVDMLAMYGPVLPPQLLAGPVCDHIYKLKVKASGIQLRPHLCKGPIDNNNEFTFLCGAIEKDDALDPPDVCERSQANRETILKDNRRRKSYERLIPEAQE